MIFPFLTENGYVRITFPLLQERRRRQKPHSLHLRPRASDDRESKAARVPAGPFSRCSPPLDRSGENLPEAFVQLDKTDAGERDFVYTGPGCGCRSGRPGTCSGLASHSGVTAPSRVALHAREPFHQSSRTGGSLTTRFTARLTVSNSLSTFPRIRYPLFISTSWQKRRKADGKKTVS